MQDNREALELCNLVKGDLVTLCTSYKEPLGLIHTTSRSPSAAFTPLTTKRRCFIVSQSFTVRFIALLQN